MRKKLSVLVAVAVLLLAAPLLGAPTAWPVETSELHVVGYWPAWARYAGRRVAEIPASRVTEVNYAFAGVADGRCVLGDPRADPPNMAELVAWAQANPGVRPVLSVGGAGAEAFAAAAAPERRAEFARSCVALMRDRGFVGLDWDWEYPATPEDKSAYVELLRLTREELSALGARTGLYYTQSVAIPASAGLMGRYDLTAMAGWLDWFFVMNYDWTGPWAPTAGHHAPLYGPGGGGDGAVTRLKQAGVPGLKVVLGAPFYGRGWSGVPAEGLGLGQPYAEVVPSSQLAYRQLKAQWLPTGLTEWSVTAKQPWFYRAADGVAISFDDPHAMWEKGLYVRRQQLGGIGFWELSQDSGWELLSWANRGLARP